MNSKCICDSPNSNLKNTHYTKRNIDLIILGEKEDKGIVILECNMAIACFDIKYCPMCGEKLSEKGGKQNDLHHWNDR